MGFKHYDVLEVPKNASAEDIRKAYRKAAIKYHPDKGGDPEKFKDVSNAYQVLSDEEKRRRYDQVGDEGFNENGGDTGFHSMNPHDLFEQLFRGAGGGGFPFHVDFGFGDGGQPSKRKDHLHTISISMADAYQGVQKVLRVGLKKTCHGCRTQCYGCQGRGQITDMRRMGFMTQMLTRQCDACAGAGSVSNGCGSCNNKGFNMEEKKVDVKIPAGVQTGHRFMLHGLGEQAVSDRDVPGDLVIEVFVQPDPNFQRQGQDLMYTVKLTLAESIIGKSIVIPHFAGDIHINLEEYGIIQPQKTYVLPHKGMPGGNLILVFQIEYDKKQLNDDERKILKEAFVACGMSSN